MPSSSNCKANCLYNYIYTKKGVLPQNSRAIIFFWWTDCLNSFCFIFNKLRNCLICTTLFCVFRSLSATTWCLREYIHGQCGHYKCLKCAHFKHHLAKAAFCTNLSGRRMKEMGWHTNCLI